jgi:tetratricopeptide (TPR) repeat protein
MNRACIAILLAISCAGAGAAESPRVVPPEVAATLTSAQDAKDPQEQLARLQAYHGKAHPLVSLAIGNAQSALGHDHEAEEAFRAALALEPTLHDAAFALARVHAARQEWDAAQRLLAEHCDPALAPASVLALYAQVALARGDLRLGDALVERALLRFPDDEAVRRADLALQVRAERPPQVAAAARALLARSPRDGEAWRALAWAQQELGDAEGAVAALEAATLVAPDEATRRQVAEAEVARGEPQAALVRFRALIGAAPDPARLDCAFIAVAARAAAECGETAQALAWIELVPEATRPRELRLFAARVALQAGDAKGAVGALEPLLSSGDLDAGTLVWAAAAVERTGDTARAEALLRHATTIGGAASGLARLRLANLLARQGRGDEARAALRDQLSADPADTQARAMLDALEGRR